MTFSITARCPRTGQLGVAVSTAVPGVGWVVPYVQAGVGAIASQAMVNPWIGTHGLELLAQGVGVEEARRQLAAADPEAAIRQFGIVDAEGRATAWSGRDCYTWFGHVVGDGFVVAGNVLTGPEVLGAMAGAFWASAAEPLAERLVRVLEAGQAAGGDQRGRLSSALLVAADEVSPLVRLQVDEHPEPVGKLRLLWNRWLDDPGVGSSRFVSGRRQDEQIGLVGGRGR